MKIDGRSVGREITTQLTQDVLHLKAQGTVPHLAVILVGNDPASLSFVKQKEKTAHSIGAKLTVHHFQKIPRYQEIAEHIMRLDDDPAVHGIIIQRPFPPTLSAQTLNTRIKPQKDVDGFLPKSVHVPPLGTAVFELLMEVRFRFQIQAAKPPEVYNPQLLSWLKTQSIVLVGRGETGGKPITIALQKYRIPFININSRNDEPEEYLRVADIVIAAVGKADVIKPSHLKQGVILIGVGVHRKKEVLVGDYDEKAIAQIADFYTPTPGGVGPVNVACLMRNVVSAAKLY